MPEEPLSRLALYTARPTVRINGEERERVSTLLAAMEMIEHEDGLSTLEMRLDNIASDPAGGAGFSFEDERSFKLGDTVAVYCGEERAPTQIFQGLISGLEADFREAETPRLVVLAEDTLQKMRMKRRTRTYDRMSLADIVQTLAADHGLTPRVTGFTDTLGTQVQLNESDLAFLRRLVASNDGDLQVVDRDLQVSPRHDVRRGAVELALGSQLRRATVLADLAHQVTDVTVTGWDATRGQRISERSTVVQQAPGEGRRGTDLLRETLGERPHHVSHVLVRNDTEARALAQAAFDERQRRFVTATGTAEGNPLIRVGTHLRLTGLGPRFSNTYYVTRCCHRYDLAVGYQTDFTAETAFFGQP